MAKDERTRNKKPNIVKRLWQWFRSIDWLEPINRWKLLLVSVVAFIGIASLTFGVVTATSTKSFCSGCHEMSPEYVSHVSLAHSEMKCTKCHIKPGVANTIIGKVMALKEVYRHVTRTQPDPIYLHKAVDDIVCIQCHSENRNVTPRADLIVNHGEHVEAGISCVSCHAGVAHAKAVERGLNRDDSFDYWVKENAEMLISNKYVKPNMGTCIDCHDKVNSGEEPWKDNDYVISIPPNKFEGELVSSSDVLENIIRTQVKDVELSMECQTCHLEITTPANHTNRDWNENHDKEALEQLDQCISCHQESKWVRRLEQETMAELLDDKKPTLENYEPNKELMDKVTKQTKFCVTCHEEKIPNYQK